MRYLSILSVLFFMLASCEEIPPTLNPQGQNEPGSGDDIESQTRQVLIEEFTGVRCVNCPAGSEAIDNLLNIHSDNLVAVSIHAGIFSQPYSDSQYDFRTAEGSSLQDYVDAPLGYPTAVVNRRHFAGEESRQLGLNQWAGYIAQELQEAPRVKLELDTEYDPVTRELAAKVIIHPQVTLTEDDVRVSLFITETNIADKQLTPSGENAEYVHKHVFRDAVSPFDGRPVINTLQQGIIVDQNFSTVLSDDWVAENCHVIAFVHINGEVKDVLQAIEAAVIE